MRKLVETFASASRWALLALAVTVFAAPAELLAQTDTDVVKSGTAPAGAATEGGSGAPHRALPVTKGVQPVVWSSMPTTAEADANPDVMFFAGTCGGSSAITLDDVRVIVGSDDDNLIRTYDIVEPADLVVKNEQGEVDATKASLHRPRASQNFYDFTKVHQFSRRNFSAIEGATVGDGLVFWTGSHGRRHDGENRPNRRRLFATKIVHVARTPLLEPFGEPVTDLTQQIEATDSLKSIGLSRSIMSLHRRLEHLAPELRGFEIQALSMAADGRTLLLGLRNPITNNRAILVPIVNPTAIVEGGPAIFGDPILLMLDGRTISAMEWVPAIGNHLIVAGMPGAHDDFVLYRWSGKTDDTPVLLQELPAGLDIQSFIVSEDGTKVLVFSDDSEVRYPVSGQGTCKNKIEDGTCACRKLIDHGPKKFRALWVPLEIDAGAVQGASTATPLPSVKP